VEKEDREERVLARAAERDRPAALGDFERTEDSELKPAARLESIAREPAAS
jgi:hypothetical protein